MSEHWFVVNVHSGLYHAEHAQEGFLVLAGESSKHAYAGRSFTGGPERAPRLESG